MNPSLILSDFRFTTTTPGFSAQGLLERIHSPRLQDMPKLGAWIDAAADASLISRELMCGIAQKEQSALTLRTLSAHALADFCGYDGGDGIPQPGTEGPEQQLLAAAKCLRRWYDRWAPGTAEPCPDGNVVAANAATFALYRYTPSRADKTNLLSIWQEFGFGNPLQEGAPTMTALTPCSDSVAAVAHAAADAHARGEKTYTKNGIVFDLVTPGWCGQFVRLACVAGARMAVPNFDAWGFPWLRRYASETCRALEEGGYRVGAPNPGDIVGMSPGYKSPGHIGIYLGFNPPLIAENTSSMSRGPGTVISPLSAVMWIVRGYYRIFPSNESAQPDDLAVVVDGKIVDCHPSETAGVTRVDARVFAAALGHDLFYRVQDDGRKRIYPKPQEPPPPPS